MVDSRAKGARAETAMVTLLKKDTGLNWKRVPGSGALHADHGLKGDVYVPNEHNFWCCEVKHYKDSQLTSKVLTDKDPMLLQWWEQAIRQGEQTKKDPILFFKHDRSKWFVGMDQNDLQELICAPGNTMLPSTHIIICTNNYNLVVYTFDKWKENVLQYIEWIK
jgi:Holliday junction resolvase